MKTNNKIEGVLNQQVNAELYSAYMYLGMSAYFESLNLKGFAKWMSAQAKEEVGHGMKIFKFLSDRGNKPTLLPIKAPADKWTSPQAVFETALKHEQSVTGMIDNLVSIAQKEKDNTTFQFLQWFVEEQVEEEAQTSEIVDKLKLAKSDGSALLMLDAELGKRAE